MGDAKTPDGAAAHDAPTSNQATREVDRVRDMIFGPQMRDYEQRFLLVQRDLDRLRESLDSLGEQLSEQDRDQIKRLQQVRQELRRSDDDLRDELRQAAQKLTVDKVDRLSLGELFIQIGMNLKTGGSLNDLLTELGRAD